MKLEYEHVIFEDGENILSSDNPTPTWDCFDHEGTNIGYCYCMNGVGQFSTSEDANDHEYEFGAGQLTGIIAFMQQLAQQKGTPDAND